MVSPYFYESVYALAFACLIFRLALRYWEKTVNAVLSPGEKSLRAAYVAFRTNWLAVYYLTMGGDWLQGPYLYALYKAYGYPLDSIAVLFMAGYVSSAVFGTFVGSIADRYGRKKLCIAFCCLYSASCVTKFYADYTVLLLGRVLSGISTSLLFSVFEAWMVAEHDARGFNPAWLTDTFSCAAFGNGLVAMLSGVSANYLSKWSGTFTAPYATAIVLFMAALFIICFTWPENRRSAANVSAGSSFATLKEALKLIVTETDVFLLGFIQSFFEGSMYTFVFLWGPTLEAVVQERPLPYGIIFSGFMVCIMIGSMCFSMLRNHFGWSPYLIAQPMFAVGAFALSIPSSSKSPLGTYWAFNVFEVVCGIYWPTIGTLRSKHLPERLRATLMSIFRVPLNLIVIISLTNSAGSDSSVIFTTCALLMCVCLTFVVVLRSTPPRAAMDVALQLPSALSTTAYGKVRNTPPNSAS